MKRIILSIALLFCQRSTASACATDDPELLPYARGTYSKHCGAATTLEVTFEQGPNRNRKVAESIRPSRCCACAASNTLALFEQDEECIQNPFKQKRTNKVSMNPKLEAELKAFLSSIKPTLNTLLADPKPPVDFAQLLFILYKTSTASYNIVKDVPEKKMKAEY